MNTLTGVSKPPSDRSVQAVQERRERLVQTVERRRICTIAELAGVLDVSEMTVRRDVGALVPEGRVGAFHGGVRAPGEGGLLGTDYAVRAELERDTKLRLAERALEMANTLSVIGIDSGTTGAALAELLPTGKRIRVVTASLPVIAALNTNRDVEVTAVGGVLHVESQSFVGVSTAAAARELHIETFFLTASAASGRGVFCTYELAAGVKRSFMDSADRVVLVADSSKFKQGAMTRISGWDRVNVIVTDEGLDDSTGGYLQMQGVEVVVVPSRESAEAHPKSILKG